MKRLANLFLLLLVVFILTTSLAFAAFSGTDNRLFSEPVTLFLVGVGLISFAGILREF